MPIDLTDRHLWTFEQNMLSFGASDRIVELT